LKSPRIIEREGDDENTEAKSVRMADKKRIQSERDAGKYAIVVKNGSNA